MPEPPQPIRAISVPRLFIIGFCLVLLGKLTLAFSLDLYSDEIFYWLASTHPAPAYSDLPFMTALLVWLGTAIGGDHAFSVRLVFLLMGSSLPLLVYWLARPITNRQQALESALLTLCLPLAGFLGLLAVPDVPLLFFGVTALGCFERALRVNAMRYWLATGIVVALGLSTHYRFFLYPLAAILFLLIHRSGRRQWRNPGLWIAMLIATVGLLPILWFNLNNHLSSASFYFVERHPWTFHASGLLHIFKQAGLVTPLLYGLFLYILWTLIRKARADATAALFLSFSLTNMLVYLLLAPWTDATSTSIHWPLSAYMPLLVFAPGALRDLYHYSARRWQPLTAQRITLSVPALGFCGTLVALAGIGSQALQQPLQPLLGTGVLSNKMAGWKQFASHTHSVIDRYYPDITPIIVTDKYYTAAQAEFAGLTDNSYTLDQTKAVSDGRLTQLMLWGKDIEGLRRLRQQPLLIITEDSTLDQPDKFTLMQQVCALSESVEFVDELSLFGGDKRFSYYTARRNSTAANTLSHPCPYPAEAWLDFPQANSTVSGNQEIAGWAFNEDIGIKQVYLRIDGERYAQLSYGARRPDVVAVKHISSDPQAPAIGFNYLLDSTTLSNGRHWIELEVINNNGMITRHSERRVNVQN